MTKNKKDRRGPKSGQRDVARSQPSPPRPVQEPFPLQLDLTTASVEVAHMESSFRGPVPPPEMLASYEALVPGSAREIIDMAKMEQEHRHSVVERAMEATISSDRRGQTFGFVLALIGLLGAIAIMLIGREHLAAVASGAVLGGLDLVGLVALFLARANEERSGRSKPDSGSKK